MYPRERNLKSLPIGLKRSSRLGRGFFSRPKQSIKRTSKPRIFFYRRRDATLEVVRSGQDDYYSIYYLYFPIPTRSVFNKTKYLRVSLISPKKIISMKTFQYPPHTINRFSIRCTTFFWFRLKTIPKSVLD